MNVANTHCVTLVETSTAEVFGIVGTIDAIIRLAGLAVLLAFDGIDSRKGCIVGSKVEGYVGVRVGDVDGTALGASVKPLAGSAQTFASKGSHTPSQLASPKES